jgi:hypothetical protein
VFHPFGRANISQKYRTANFFKKKMVFSVKKVVIPVLKVG